jgi:chloramphenicol O-acetyltransferase type A
VVEYETIYAGSTVLTENETFNFCYIDYFESYKQFNLNALEKIKQSKSTSHAFAARDDELGLIHFSSMPWVSFSSITHARNFNTLDSVPKIVFGKFYKKKKKWYLPISIEVHHALMDGLHVGRYLSLLQTQINTNY